MKLTERSREYRQVARAASTAATRERIVDAFLALFWAHPGEQASLEEIAREAGVTVQTVIRHFGGREGLTAAAGERESSRVAAERDPSSAGSTRDAVSQLVAHYERLGDSVLAMLAEESRVPALRDIAERGRAAHRAWCEAVFKGALGRLDGPTRARRLAQLVAVCDVQTWKLLRRDAGLGRDETELALLELLDPLLEAR